jgi:ferredoxin
MKIVVNGQVLKVGSEDTLIELLRNNGIKIKNNCEGNCACGQCLIELEKDAYRLLKVADEELDLLEKQLGVTKYSRLACQVRIDDLKKLGADEIAVRVV